MGEFMSGIDLFRQHARSSFHLDLLFDKQVGEKLTDCIALSEDCYGHLGLSFQGGLLQFYEHAILTY